MCARKTCACLHIYPRSLLVVERRNLSNQRHQGRAIAADGDGLVVCCTARCNVTAWLEGALPNEPQRRSEWPELVCRAREYPARNRRGGPATCYSLRSSTPGSEHEAGQRWSRPASHAAVSGGRQECTAHASPLSAAGNGAARRGAAIVASRRTRRRGFSPRGRLFECGRSTLMFR